MSEDPSARANGRSPQLFLLRERARAHLLAQEPSDVDAVITETLHDPDGGYMHGGVQYTAFLLACTLQGQVCSLGVVLLASDGTQPLAGPDLSLLEGVALQLLQKGDADGVLNLHASGV